jgi:V8-like Glu-specific endopeptidase
MNDNPVASLVSERGIQRTPEIGYTAKLKEQQDRAAAARFEARKAVRQQADKLKDQGLFLELADPAKIAERAARKGGKAQASPNLVQAVISAAKMPARSMSAAIERIIGSNDLLPVAYFGHGALAADAVGRVVTTDGQGHELSYGTGFLVAPGVILTNHHVLPDADTAELSVIQFNYQAGVDGQMERFDVAHIDKNRYLSNEELDFALVGIIPAAGSRQRTVLPLIASSAKILPDEPVAIIEHPRALPKQVALRENKVVDLLPDFVHYTTDTEPGASGSPVFNDQWEVVALHHASVPAGGTGAAGASASWIANEGVRISRIVAYLKELHSLSAPVQQMVAAVLQQEAFTPLPSLDGGAAAASPTFKPAAGQERQAEKMTLAPGTQVSLDAGAYVTEITISVRPPDAPARLPGARDEGLVSDVARGAARVADQVLGMVGVQTRLPAFVQTLEPGDVLLYNGTGILSDAIKYFTNSDVSHVALYLGGDGRGLIGEAVDAGVIRDAPEQSFPGHNWVVVHRLRDKRDMTPVLNRGNYYLDKKLQYAYPQLVFLGILLLTKKLRPSGILGKMIQAVSVAASEALNRFLESGKELMICSEFVYRAYDEAVSGQANPFHLEIPGIAREAYAPTAPAIEEGSIAATLLAQPQLLQPGFAEAAERAVVQLPLNQELLQKQAERLVAEYLAEVQYGRPPSEPVEPVERLVPQAQLGAAVSRFAITLAAVRHQAAGAGKEEALAAATQPAAVGQELPPALQALFRTPADFVTPADLRRSSSLTEVGRVF